MKILTWQVHGNYLLYLAKFSPHMFYLPVEENGLGGRGHVFPYGKNVKDIPVADVKSSQFDCVLFQNLKNWLEDKDDILSSEQTRLPRIYLEHRPPLEDPSEQVHPVANEHNMLLVHVTPFNALMWDSGSVATRVIDHGVFLMNEAKATYELGRGLTAVDNILTRGRHVGADIFRAACDDGVPLDLIGMNSEDAGGLGVIQEPKLTTFMSRYRFFFSPSRYTSLNLAVIEAMLVGLPIVALATTELATVIDDGVSGFVETDPEKLFERMHALLEDEELARKLGTAAREYALERFSMERFTRQWNEAFAFATSARVSESAILR